MIVNVAGQDRRFIHCVGANGEFRASDLTPRRLARCRILYLGGYFVMPGLLQEELVPLFAAARKAGVTTVLDVATTGPGQYVSRIDKLLPHVDVFLPSNDEGERITGERDPLRQAELFRGMGVGTAIVTLGGEGAVLAPNGYWGCNA